LVPDCSLADKVTTGAIPVPLSDTVCGLVGASLVSVSVPLRAPIAVGVKVTVIVHVAFTAMLAVQPVLVCEKSPAIAMLEIVSAALPLFVTVTVWVALDVPTSVLLKVSEVTESDNPATGGVNAKSPP
jgi:hypothetical protein